MKKNGNLCAFLHILMFATGILFCLISVLPVSISFADVVNDDYEIFNSDFLSMMNEYGFDEDQDVAVAYSADFSNDQDEKEQEIKLNRLIVKNVGQVDDFGAVAKAEFKDLHIFQYQNAQDTACAYENFCNLNVKVAYDEIVCAENVTVETTYSNAWANKDFNSWGADYVGYKNYVSNMYRFEIEPQEVVVAVLDTGINTSHVLFKNRILHSYARDFTGEKSNTKYSYEDLKNHGSHVSGIIADATPENVKILPLKVLNKNGRGTVAMIVSALSYMTNLKASGLNIFTANISIGVENPNGGIANFPILENEIVSAYNKNIVCVVSAGNESRNTIFSSPANVDEAFTVSALMKNRNSVEFDYSYSNYGNHVDFSAPGTGILSAGINGAYDLIPLDGTSMAAPHVTACVALVFSNPKYRNFTVDQVYDLLKENAIDLGDEGWDEDYGHGLINVEKIGVNYVGNVNFSQPNEFADMENQICHSGSFVLSLDFSAVEGDVEIYYTTDEFATTVDDTTGKLYESPFTINKTTKVTAVAYVKNKAANLQPTQSFVTTKEFYFDDVDLLSNYEYETFASGYQIKKYNGKLKTLHTPSLVLGHRVVGVAKNAFNSSKVENLYLQNGNYLFNIDSFAFENNHTLKQVHCQAESVGVNTKAFYNCSNLETVDIPNIVSVGNNAFSYCKKLQSLELFKTEKVGDGAFINSGLKQLYFGKNINSIGEHSIYANLNLDTVFGYSQSVAETFADKHNVQFFDLTLRFEKDLPEKLIVKQNQAFSIFVSTVGRNVSGDLSLDGFVYDVEENDFTQNWIFTSNGLEKGTYDFKLNCFDADENQIESKLLKIEVVDENADVFFVDFQTNENFKVFVDGNLIDFSQGFSQLSTHIVEIKPLAGFVLNNVFVNGQAVSSEQIGLLSCKFEVSLNSQNLSIEVETSPKTTLTVNFEGDGLEKVIVDQKEIESQEVERNGSLTFSIVAQEGLCIKRVSINGKILKELEGQKGTYTINDIVSDLQVEIEFENQFNEVQVVCGKGGVVSTNGSAEKTELAYGEKRIYTVSAYEGFEIDFVSVNGNLVKVVNNQFEVVNTSESNKQLISVVISFKQEKNNGFSSLMGLYLIVFGSLILVFVVASVILHFVRKRNKYE